MQFHLDGFRTGDPDIAAASDRTARSGSDQLPAIADVLIVGCGPAGLTLRRVRYPMWLCEHVSLSAAVYHSCIAGKASSRLA